MKIWPLVVAIAALLFFFLWFDLQRSRDVYAMCRGLGHSSVYCFGAAVDR